MTSPIPLDYLRQQQRALNAQHDAARDRMSAITAPARQAQRDLTPAEAASYRDARATVDDLDRQVRDMRDQVADAEEAERRGTALQQVRASLGSGGAVESPARWHTSGATYRRGDPDPSRSWTRDMISVALGRGDHEAQERLRRNTAEFRDAAAQAPELRALSTTDGAGGDFVPPAWLVNQFVAFARAARPTADRVNNRPLPTGTDSLNVPRFATGTAVAEQTTQNTAIQQTDATTNAVTAAVATIAGGQTVAVQLIEQSPINFDEEIMRDLTADLAAKTDVFVLNNNVAAKRGLLNVSGVNAITFTQASPTVALLYPKIADARQQIDTGRFMPADTIVMHPRRWAWFLAAGDTAGRPLILPAGGGPGYNAVGVAGTPASQGLVGNIAGVDVVTDPNLPTNLGAGTNQDPIIVMRASDQYLYEGNLNIEAFRETKADQLSVFIRLYRYIAFTAERYPKSISVINGTGLVAPSF